MRLMTKRNIKRRVLLLGKLKEKNRNLQEIHKHTHVLFPPSAQPVSLSKGKFLGLYKTGSKVYIKQLLRLIKSAFKIRRMKYIDTAFLVTHSHSAYFYHWIVDVGQKFELLEKTFLHAAQLYEDQKLGPRQIIIPADHTGEIFSYLTSQYELDFFFQKKHEIILVKNLIEIKHSDSGLADKILVHSLRERLRRDVQENAKKRKILISRRYAKTRKLVNEENLVDMFPRDDVEVVHMEDLPLREQIDLAANTRLMMGLHGAGLVNLIWMRPGAKLVEIRVPSKVTHNCYKNLCEIFGVEYQALVATDCSRKYKRSQDVFISADQLTALAKMVKDSN